MHSIVFVALAIISNPAFASGDGAYEWAGSFKVKVYLHSCFVHDRLRMYMGNERILQAPSNNG